MNRLFLITLLPLLIATSFSAQAVPIGPTYPASGGNNFTSNSVSAADGTAIWSYSNFDVSGLNKLYFGLDQMTYGPAGAGLNFNADPFSFNSASGSTAIWLGSTDWDNPDVLGNALTTVATRLTMSVDNGLSWNTNLASLGLDDIGTFGSLGAVVDNSSGVNFNLTWKIEANTGSGWQAINDVRQLSTPGPTRSSVATGFYHVVPVPTTLGLFGIGLAGLGWSRRKKV